MDEITRAYIKVHGECPKARWSTKALYWYQGRAMFRSGWKSALAWMEEQEAISPVCPYCGVDKIKCWSPKDYPDGPYTWECDNSQCEMEEIEKDVLEQQSDAREGR